MHKYLCFDDSIQKRHLSILLYVMCAIVFGVSNVLRLYVKTPFGNLWGYNNPILIMGAISLFVFMSTYKFQSEFINKISKGVLAAYLITDIPYVGNILYSKYSEWSFTFPSILIKVIVTLIVAVFITLFASTMDIL